MTDVRVFLSWSGNKSKFVARALRSALEKLADNVKPWLSEDMEPGRSWADELPTLIQKSQVAIVCLTSRNALAPWLAFEAGIYHSASIDNTNVMPYLLDFEPEELQFPIGLYQARKADWIGTKAIFGKIAEYAGVGGDDFSSWFAAEWPGLEDQIRSAADISASGERVEEEGEWMNLASAFYLGHDLRWTLAAIDAGESLENIQHGLKQVLHHADELGLAGDKDFKILNAQAQLVWGMTDDQWTPELAAQVWSQVNDAFIGFGSTVETRQPGFKSHPDDNTDMWLKIKMARKA